MRVQIAQPVASAQQLQAFFQSTLPQHEHFTRGGSAVVGAGLVTGVVVKPDGPNAVSLGWEIPNIGVKLLMVFSIVAGILPGLLLWGLVWLVISGDVERLKQEIAQALTTGAPVQAGSPMASIPSRPGRPGGVALAFGILFTLMGFAALAYSAHMFDRASSADRIGASSSSYGSTSYGSTYRSALGPEFWSSIARRRREEAFASGGGGLVNLLIAFALFAVRRSKVRAWEADPANNMPMGMMGQAQYGQPQGQPQYGQPMGQPQYGQPQYGQPQGQPQYGQPQYGQPQGQPQYGQPQSGPNPYGSTPQGAWPPGAVGFPPGGQGPTQG